MRSGFRFHSGPVRGAGTRVALLAGAVLATLGTLLVSAPVAGGDDDTQGQFCSKTAMLLFEACGFEVQDDATKASAKCLNVSGATERRTCYAEARASRSEARKTCREQREWRLAACKRIGEGRYDPDFDPASFDDPRHPTKPNPYFPLQVGNHWEFKGEGEVNTLDVLDQTKLIDGVSCLVVRDQVVLDGELHEDTDDWYASAKDGNVWYCGEEVKDYESFQGDDPRLPELVKIDGSFKAGRNRDKPGVIFQASPTRGRSYLEEFSLGNAEDVTDVLSTTYSFGADPELDEFVPPALVQRLCAGACVVTRNYSLLQPGVVARKYYARGIGFFLEVKPETGSATRLTSCNFDPRCSSLPQP